MNMNNGKTCSRGVGHVVIDVLQTDCIVRCYSSDHPNPDSPETRQKHFTRISYKKQWICNHLRKPRQADKVDDTIKSADNNVEDADDQGGEKQDLLRLHHPKDDCSIDYDVGDGPNDRPHPIAWNLRS